MIFLSVLRELSGDKYFNQWLKKVYSFVVKIGIRVQKNRPEAERDDIRVVCLKCEDFPFSRAKSLQPRLPAAQILLLHLNHPRATVSPRREYKGV